MEDKIDRDRERALIALVREKAQSYLRAPGVTSVGVGYRTVRDEVSEDVITTDELCIQFTVAQKLSTESLREKGHRPLPESFEADDGSKVAVQVIERSFLPSYDVVSDPMSASMQIETSPHKMRRSRIDPVVPGVSISHVQGSAGTIGAIVFDNEKGVPLLLSNWHVLQGPSGYIGQSVVQPGPYDDADVRNNRIGRLVRSHLGLAGDCAVSTIESRGYSEEVLELGAVPARAAKVHLGDAVVKSGRTTGVTYGIVSRVGVTVELDYGGSVGTRNIGGFEIAPNPEKPAANGEISMGGDSGSIWMIDGSDEERDIVVGLHFAGEDPALQSVEYALACNIHSVLDKLRVSLIDTVSPVVSGEKLWNETLQRVGTLERRVATLEQQDAASMDAPTKEKNDPIATPQKLQLPIYGNWCGPGHGSGEPVDDVDLACMKHDKCWQREGILNCGCDAQLIEDINRALDAGYVKDWGRALGPIIRDWFRIQPCLTRVGGIPIPAGTGGTTRFVRRVGNLWRSIRS